MKSLSRLAFARKLDVLSESSFGSFRDRDKGLLTWACVAFSCCIDSIKCSLLFQQLELITPFQLYFNPELIFKHFQVSFLKYGRFLSKLLTLEVLVFSKFSVTNYYDFSYWNYILRKVMKLECRSLYLSLGLGFVDCKVCFSYIVTCFSI